MKFESGKKENRLYLLIAFFILILILFTMILSSNKITTAYVEDDSLGEDWYEDRDDKEYSDSQVFGLEKHASFTYRAKNKSYPSFLTVNTYKTVFMMSENELYDKTVDFIEKELDKRNITIDKNATIEGERTLVNGHTTFYIKYTGMLYNNNQTYKVKIQGETWNCERSGTSIIAVGYSQVTNNTIGQSENLKYWIDLVEDDGLISNIKCH